MMDAGVVGAGGDGWDDDGEIWNDDDDEDAWEQERPGDSTQV